MAESDWKVSRRRFLQMTAVSPLAFKAIDEVGGVRLHSQEWNAIDIRPTKALGADILSGQADEIVKLFASAQLATLSTYYQLFWPLAPGGYVVSELAPAIAKFRNVNPNNRNMHRLAALPVVAQIHAIPQYGREAAELADSQSVMELNRWLSSDNSIDTFNFKRREAIEIVWQNATCAVIRNFDNWTSFEAPELADEAARHVYFFMNNDFPELLLPTVCALQFLLTYRSSLNSRDTPTHLGQVERLCAHILSQATAQNNYWVLELMRIYAKRQIFYVAPSQVNESFISDGDIHDPFFRYSNQVRLASAVATVDAASGATISPYILRDSSAGTKGISIFDNLGRSEGTIRELLSDLPFTGSLKNGFTQRAQTIAFDMLKRAQETEGAAFEKPEALLLGRFQRLFPLRQYDSLKQLKDFQLSLGRPYSFEALAFGFGAGELRKDLVIEHWTQQVQRQTTQFEGVKFLRSFVDDTLKRASEFAKRHFEKQEDAIDTFWKEEMRPALKEAVGVMPAAVRNVGGIAPISLESEKAMSSIGEDTAASGASQTSSENLLHRPGTLARFVQVARDLKLTAPEVEERMRKAKLRFMEGADAQHTPEQEDRKI